MHELAEIARAVSAETGFHGAARRLEIEAKKLTRSSDVLCVAFDWARRSAWTAQGPIVNATVLELIGSVPNRYEAFILSNRKILGDQMEFLLRGVPRGSRVHLED